MKKFFYLLIGLTMLSACTSSASMVTPTPSITPVSETSLPDKPLADSPLAIDSPIDATNIDDYLFIDGVQYV